MMTRTARDAVGYLARSGKKIDFICPYCGWVHSMDARSVSLDESDRFEHINYDLIAYHRAPGQCIG